eukprot:jgi/Undpi1/7004/HiC_scaffold_21.g09478.m1
MARTPRTPALPATPPAASATAAAASTGGGPSSPPAPRSTAESPPSAPVKDKPISSFADYKEKWNTPATAKTTKLEFDEELRCNRPSCPFTLVQFIPPGTNPQTGVTFAVCRSGSCAGGGTILRYSAKCCACHGTIPEGTVCLSVKTDYDNKFTNQHLRNCLLDKAKGTDNAAFACNAAVKDDKRHKNYLKKEQESAEKKLKVESAVGFAALAPDSDDDL